MSKARDIADLGSNDVLETSSTGVEVTGDVSLGDNGKAKFGASDDLQIFHDGIASYIADTGTGTLNIKASGSIRLRGNDTDELLARFNENGSNQFYYDNSEKLATTSTGVDVTGTVTADGLTVSATNGIASLVGTTGWSGVDITKTNGGLLLGLDDGSTFGNSDGTAIVRNSAGKDLVYLNGTTERMRIDSSGNVGIGTASPASRLELSGIGSGAWLTLDRQDTNTNIIDFTETGSRLGYIGYISDDLTINNNKTSNTIFYTNGSERARIDSSGNLLVGTTSESNWETVAGFRARPSGSTTVTRSSAPALYVNRLSNDGSIVNFLKDGSTVGSIGYSTSGLYIDGEAGHSGIQFAGNNWLPRDSGAAVDNLVDIGVASLRFDDIYATNGTIQTSDRNEKQDIEVLSEAEQRVAQACKGLLRKFRWKDSVAEKGDDARIHFGIIAQDLQDAFTAEGLDAGRYAMFISSTWTDEETGEERTRLGVRYPELLAFIISAL